MCGICGIYTFEEPLASVDHERVAAMTLALQHRGPDDDGYYKTEKVSLGHRRLSIIDLSFGKQPIFNEDRTCLIVFNGEIYNFRELRRDLEKKGHSFQTGTDTEVILHQYEEDGWECVRKLNGMFAFAIWDVRNQTFLLARDRIGIKPLYIARSKSRIIFCSELHPLIKYGSVEKNIDEYSLYCLLNLQYVPAPQTMFRSIRKLRPGYVLIAQKDRVEEKRYWSVRVQEEPDWNYQAAQTELLHLLKDAVQRRLIADVPLGAFLSGGLDSSTIVGLMSQMIDRPVQTFSVGFADSPNHNETGYAKLVSRHFRTDHHQLIISPGELAETLPAIWGHLDGPITDPAAIPTYLVSKLAKEHVTVVLTGEGADELFAGYLRYALDSWHFYFRWPLFLRQQIMRPFLSKIPESGRWLKGFEAITTSRDIDRHLRWVSVFDQDLLGQILKNSNPQAAFDKTVDFISRLIVSEKCSSLNRSLALDLQTWLPDDLLAKVDSMSMAVSLEARVPFLDHRIIELALKMPPSWKIKGNLRKRILKDTVSGLIPATILGRKKMGFDLPLKDWFRGSLRQLLQDTLASERLARHSFFNQDIIDKSLEQYFSGQQDFSFQLWSIFIFQNWYEYNF